MAMNTPTTIEELLDAVFSVCHERKIWPWFLLGLEPRIITVLSKASRNLPKTKVPVVYSVYINDAPAAPRNHLAPFTVITEFGAL
jgi:hypothetical protein